MSWEEYPDSDSVSAKKFWKYRKKKRATANRIKNEIIFIVWSVTGDVMLIEWWHTEESGGEIRLGPGKRIASKWLQSWRSSCWGNVSTWIFQSWETPGQGVGRIRPFSKPARDSAKVSVGIHSLYWPKARTFVCVDLVSLAFYFAFSSCRTRVWMLLSLSTLWARAAKKA